MISGNIQQLSAYLNSEIVQPIIDFLNKQNIQTLAAGKYSAAANGISAIVIKTNSRDLKGQQFEAHRQNLDASKRQALFGIVQGGRHEDLRRESAREIARLGFDGVGIGGPFSHEGMRSEASSGNSGLSRRTVAESRS